MNGLVKILAKIELYKGVNMRTFPIVDRYRPMFYFSGSATHISGQITLVNANRIEPGASGIVEIDFIRGVISDSYFQNGVGFTFSEGTHPLGKGEIINS